MTIYDGTRGKVMAGFQRGLLVGSDESAAPRDNMDLERWFREPKAHERCMHGHQHAGVRIGQEGATLVRAFAVDRQHLAIFAPWELLP